MSDLKKVRVELLNETTGEVIEDVDVLTSSSCVGYTNSEPTVSAIGGIAAGTTFTDTNVKSILDSLLYPYMPPVLSISAAPSGGVFEKGSQVTPTVTLTATKKSKSIISGGTYINDIQKNTVEFAAGGGTVTDNNIGVITTDSNITGKVSDGQSTITSNAINYSFVYPAYVGSVDAAITAATITETDIEAMTKKIIKPANISNSYTITNKKMCIALPTGWTLSKILDPNSFDMIGSFETATVAVTGIDTTPVNYTVYVLKNPTTQTSFTVSYNK